MSQVVQFYLFLMVFSLLLPEQSQAQRLLEVPGGAKSAITAVHPNLVYIGYAQRGVKVVLGNQFFDLGVSLPDSQVRSLAFHNGVLWVGTLSGLFRVEGNGFTTFSRAGGQLPGDTVHALQQYAGRLAVGTNAGLVFFDGQQWQQPAGSPAALPVTYMKVHDNKLCLVQAGQVLLYDNSSFQTIAPPPGQPITKAIPYPGGGLLMASTDSVFYRTLSGTIHPLPVVWLSDFEVGSHPDRVMMLTGSQLYTFDRGEVQFRNLLRTGNISSFMDRDGSGWLHVLTVNRLQSFPEDDFYDPRPNSWNVKTLDINQIGARLESKGDFFNGVAGGAYHVPKGGLNNVPVKTIFTGALWMGGYTSGGALHQSAQTYRQFIDHGQPFQAGLLDAQGQYDSLTGGRFDRVWKLSKFDIEAFRLAWQQGRVQDRTYTPPTDLCEWPGNRPGTLETLAPFYDANGDGIYNHMDGDYPLIKGDQALWWVYNDRSPQRDVGPPMGVEVHALAYAFVCEQASGGDTIINYTTFMDLKLHNKSSSTYVNTYLGLFFDGDIGNSWNDLVGMDVANDGYYFYNEADFDDGILGYGYNPPAQGVYLLKGPLADVGDGLDNNRDGNIDESGERMAYSNFLAFKNDGTQVGNPVFARDFERYSRGIWRDSVGMVFGGFGYPGSPQSTSIPARFMFPGTTDPNGWGIGGSLQQPVTPPFIWTEGAMPTTGPNTPATDFRGVGGIGPFTFSPGQSVDLTFALIFSRGNDSTAQGSVTRLLEHDASRIRQWYAQGNFPSCLDLSTVGVAELKVQEAQVRFYPNPVESVLLVELLEAGPAEVQLYDLQGRLLQTHLLQGAQAHSLDVQSLHAGMYLVRVQQGGKLKVYKMVKK